MSKKGICLHYEDKLKSNHDHKFKWLVMLLVDEDKLDDDIILIGSNEKRGEKSI